jgi:hypothetical protein
VEMGFSKKVPWQRPGFVTSVNETSVPQLLDRFFEGVARAEGGNLLG